jgi:hypothetical protein
VNFSLSVQTKYSKKICPLVSDTAQFARTDTARPAENMGYLQDCASDFAQNTSKNRVQYLSSIFANELERLTPGNPVSKNQAR